MEDEQDSMIELPVIGHLTFREAHAFVDGLYSGIVDTENKEYTQEKHYWRSGWMLGDLYDQFYRDNS